MKRLTEKDFGLKEGILEKVLEGSNIGTFKNKNYLKAAVWDIIRSDDKLMGIRVQNAFVQHCYQVMKYPLEKKYFGSMDFTSLDRSSIKSHAFEAIARALLKEKEDGLLMPTKGFCNYAFISAVNSIKRSVVGSESGSLITVPLERQKKEDEDLKQFQKDLKKSRHVGCSVSLDDFEEEQVNALLDSPDFFSYLSGMSNNLEQTVVKEVIEMIDKTVILKTIFYEGNEGVSRLRASFEKEGEAKNIFKMLRNEVRDFSKVTGESPDDMFKNITGIFQRKRRTKAEMALA